MYKSINIRQYQKVFDNQLAQLNLCSPIIIGGVGGSGTRLVAQLLQNLGIFIGISRNNTEDAIPFIPVYEQHINSYLSEKLCEKSFINDLKLAIEQHVDLSENIHQWAWKNPRSIYLLPLFEQLFKNMRYIHVIRDGIAMSTSLNQQQLAKHGDLVIPDDTQNLPEHEKSLLLWSIVNSAAADFGEQNLGSRYLRIKYEDACHSPLAVIQKIAEFLAIPLNYDLTQNNLPQIQQTLRLKPQFSEATTIRSASSLKRFGYVC